MQYSLHCTLCPQIHRSSTKLNRRASTRWRGSGDGLIRCNAENFKPSWQTDIQTTCRAKVEALHRVQFSGKSNYNSCDSLGMNITKNIWNRTHEYCTWTNNVLPISGVSTSRMVQRWGPINRETIQGTPPRIQSLQLPNGKQRRNFLTIDLYI